MNPCKLSKKTKKSLYTREKSLYTREGVFVNGAFSGIYERPKIPIAY